MILVRNLLSSVTFWQGCVIADPTHLQNKREESHNELLFNLRNIIPHTSNHRIVMGELSPTVIGLTELQFCHGWSNTSKLQEREEADDGWLFTPITSFFKHTIKRFSLVDFTSN